MLKIVPAPSKSAVHVCCEYYPTHRNGTNKVRQMEMDGLFEGGEQTTLSGSGLGPWFSNYGMEKQHGEHVKTLVSFQSF